MKLITEIGRALDQWMAEQEKPEDVGRIPDNRLPEIYAHVRKQVGDASSLSPEGLRQIVDDQLIQRGRQPKAPEGPDGRPVARAGLDFRFELIHSRGVEHHQATSAAIRTLAAMVPADLELEWNRTPEIENARGGLSPYVFHAGHGESSLALHLHEQAQSREPFRGTGVPEELVELGGPTAWLADALARQEFPRDLIGKTLHAALSLGFCRGVIGSRAHLPRTVPSSAQVADRTSDGDALWDLVGRRLRAAKGELSDLRPFLEQAIDLGEAMGRSVAELAYGDRRMTAGEAVAFRWEGREQLAGAIESGEWPRLFS